MDMKLEVMVVPVSDVDKAKDFYARLGWRRQRRSAQLTQAADSSAAVVVNQS